MTANAYGQARSGGMRQTRSAGVKRKWTPIKVVSMIILLLSTIVFIFPFYWIVTGAFKIQTVATAIPPEWFPLEPTIGNWQELFKNPIGRWTLNSFVISIVKCSRYASSRQRRATCWRKSNFRAGKSFSRCLSPLWRCRSRSYSFLCSRCWLISVG